MSTVSPGNVAYRRDGAAWTTPPSSWWRTLPASPHAHVQMPIQGPSGNDMEIVMNGAIINEIGYGMKIENGYMDKAVADDAVNGLVLLL